MSTNKISYFKSFYPKMELDMNTNNTKTKLIFLHNYFEWNKFLEELQEDIVYVAFVELIPDSSEDFNIILSIPILLTKNSNAWLLASFFFGL